MNFNEIMNGKKRTTRRQPSKGVRLTSYKPKSFNLDKMFPKKKQTSSMFKSKSNDIDRVLPNTKASFSMDKLFPKKPMSKPFTQPREHQENSQLREVRGMIKNKNPNIIIINNGEQRQNKGFLQPGKPKIKRVMTAFDGDSNIDAVYDSDLDGIPDHLDPEPHNPEIRMPLTRQGKKTTRSRRAMNSIIDDI